ncbi:MAG: hypothetical protein ACRDTD_04435 [Pseudonocardiaceae bacterium]
MLQPQEHERSHNLPQVGPLAILPGAPPDQEQICPACQVGLPSPATQTRQNHA